MKKLIAVILTLCLCLGALPALAAPGDAALLRADESGYSSGVVGAAVLGDTLYIATYNGLFSYQVGDQEPTALTPAGEQGDIYDIRTLLSGGDKLYTLMNSYEEGPDGRGRQGLGLAEVQLGEGGYTLGEQMPLDVSGLELEEDDYVYLPEFGSPLISGGKLYLVGSDYRVDKGTLYAFEMETGKRSQVDTGALSVISVTAYGAGKAIVLMRDNQNWGPAQLGTLDLEGGQLTELGAMQADVYGVCGPYWDEASSTLYYGSENQLYQVRLDDLSNPKRVSDLPTNGGYGGSIPTGMMLPGGYYVYPSYDAVLVRNTDPQAQPEKLITVQGYYEADSAYYAFTARYPQVGVVLGNSMSSDDITQAMMNRSQESDIFRLSVNSDAYRALMNRGYLLPITGEAAKAAVGKMYPAVVEAMSAGGQLMAVPVSTYTTSLHYNENVLKKMGLTEAELPTTWEGMIEFIARWGERYKEEFPELSLFEPPMMPNIREMMVRYILDDYMLTLDRPGAQIAYDTPVLKNLLTQLDQADFSAVETEASEDGSYSWDGETILFETSDLISRWNEGLKPWPLKLSEDIPTALQMSLEVLVVNPFSQNQQEAMNFLDCVVENYTPEMRIALMPGENEPVRDSRYEYDMAQYRKMVDEAKKMADEADAADKQMMEENYNNQLKYMEDYDSKYSWRITASTIEQYRALAGDMVVLTNQGFGEKNSADLYEMIQRYINRELSVDQFLKTMEQKARMMMMEGY